MPTKPKPITNHSISPDFITAVYHISETTSTNDAVKAIAAENGHATALLIADTQTAGRGRSSGRFWYSSPHSLQFSMCLRPPKAAPGLPASTLITAMAITDTLKHYGLDAKIKWPNDILVNGKKICGILTELSAASDDYCRLVIGAGINVNLKTFPAEIAQTATSIYQQTERRTDKIELLSHTVNTFQLYYEKHIIRDEPFIDQYRALCVTIGKQITFMQNGITKKATAIDVNENGELIAIDTDSNRFTIRSGEVKHIGKLQ